MVCSSKMLLATVVAILLAMLASPAPSHADVYLHNPKGSNNRLNEQARERNNGNRMFDSQNNGRGGYNKASTGQPYYYTGTVVPMEWTAQHACADPTNNCMFIIQYMCDTQWIVRDGNTTQTAPTPNNAGNCIDGNCDQDPRFGRHESFNYYKTCQTTYANKGLFTADQQLTNQGGLTPTTATRTNPDRTQRGYECPEERDYYPWWNPSPWKDAAIITTQPARCAAYQAESQNVKPRYSCVLRKPTASQTNSANNYQAVLPITQTECETANGVWTMTPAFNIPPPECIVANISRDNHLGNIAGSRYPMSYNWTVPSDFADSCVLRLRYNISTSDFSNIPTVTRTTDSNDGGFASPTSIQAGIDSSFNGGAGNNGNAPATTLPIWLKYGMTAAEQTPATTNGYTRGYVFIGNNNNANNGNGNGPVVDPFGSLLWADPNTTPTTESRINLRLAFNTQQFFRIFQDRTHVFAVRQRPAALANAVIHNVNVRGKSGNIVQVYPSVEYDFVPDRLVVDEGEMVHFQWWGSATNPDGPQVDKNNVIRSGAPLTSWVETTTTTSLTTYGQLGRAYVAKITDATGADKFLGYSFMDLQRLALNGLNSTYFDLGPRQVTAPGIYHYLSTRNNAFSNRNQQASIVVRPSTASYAAVPWGPEAAMSGAAAVKTGGAWIDQGQFTGQMAASQYVYVEQAGPSSYSSDWFKVEPLALSVQPNQNVWLYLPYSGSMFTTDTEVVWKSNATTQDVVVVQAASATNGQVTMSIQQGGYYAVRTSVNGTYIAAIVLGVVGAFVLFTLLYWKVRVQPLGGWKAWLREGKQARSRRGNNGNAGNDVALNKTEHQTLVSPMTIPSSPIGSNNV